MTSVALIGADGAGKTTIARELAADDSRRVRYLYLGVNSAASNHMLITTRSIAWLKRRRGRAEDHGPPPSAADIIERDGTASRWKEAKSTVRVVNQILDEWYRQAIAMVWQRRGFVVVFDRHYLADFSSHDMNGASGLPFHRRLHGFVLRHLYPEPDAVVMLDAPAEVLLERKGEGTLESLTRRRDDYLSIRDAVDRFYVVDATLPLDEVRERVAVIIDEVAGS